VNVRGGGKGEAGKGKRQGKKKGGQPESKWIPPHGKTTNSRDSERKTTGKKKGEGGERSINLRTSPPQISPRGFPLFFPKKSAPHQQKERGDTALISWIKKRGNDQLSAHFKTMHGRESEGVCLQLSSAVGSYALGHCKRNVVCERKRRKRKGGRLRRRGRKFTLKRCVFRSVLLHLSLARKNSHTTPIKGERGRHVFHERPLDVSSARKKSNWSREKKDSVADKKKAGGWSVERPTHGGREKGWSGECRGRCRGKRKKKNLERSGAERKAALRAVALSFPQSPESKKIVRGKGERRLNVGEKGKGKNEVPGVGLTRRG